MKISTATAIKDVAPWRVKLALRSRLYQTRKPDEILLIDYQSKPNNLEQYKLLAKEFSAKLIEVKHKGKETFHPARLLNVAIRQTTCDYIVFIGTDEIPSDNAFSVLEHSIENWPEGIWMSNRIDLPEESNNPNVKILENFEEWAQKGRKDIWAPGSFQGISVNWLRDVGGFDERITGWGFYDSDIIGRGLKAGLQEYYLQDRMSVLHIWHPDYRGYYKHEKITLKNKKLKEEQADIIVNKGLDWGSV